MRLHAHAYTDSHADPSTHDSTDTSLDTSTITPPDADWRADAHAAIVINARVDYAEPARSNRTEDG